MELLERLRRLLAGDPDVVEKRMVGGRSFSAAGRMFCGVTSQGLMVRVGGDGIASALDDPHVHRTVMGGRSLAAFVTVGAEGVQTETALADWVQRGRDALGRDAPAATGLSKTVRERTGHKASRVETRSAADRFDDLVGHFCTVADVTIPGLGGSRGFGSSALKVHGTIFAMLTRERLVVKLPRTRVAELIEAGSGEPFTAGKSTAMKEWLTVTADEPATWLALAREALAFVGRS